MLHFLKARESKPRETLFNSVFTSACHSFRPKLKSRGVNQCQVLKKIRKRWFWTALTFRWMTSRSNLFLQLVPFRDFVSSGGQFANETDYLETMGLLAKEVLAEVPSQVTSYMRMNGLKPRTPVMQIPTTIPSEFGGYSKVAREGYPAFLKPILWTLLELNCPVLPFISKKTSSMTLAMGDTIN